MCQKKSNLLVQRAGDEVSGVEVLNASCQQSGHLRDVIRGMEGRHMYQKVSNMHRYAMLSTTEKS